MARVGEKMPDQRQSRKRLATRQKISDAATGLFFQRGFDAVTVDEIATAADVSRMTVFNHFARKEDMLFDLDEEGRGEMLEALVARAKGVSPVEALRLFAHRAVAERRPYAMFFEAGSDRFLAIVRESEALKARARAIRDELADVMTEALARSVGRTLPDPAAALAASMLLATWTVALGEAHGAYRRDGNTAAAMQLFFRLVDQGTRGVRAAIPGTPYV